LTSLVIAVLSFVGMVMSYFKLPPVAQYLLKRYHLVTDFIVFVFTYLTITAISKTIVGLVSATIVAFMADLAIRFLKLMDDDPEVYEGFLRRNAQLKKVTISLIKRVL
jgi:hypothetical protein